MLPCFHTFCQPCLERCQEHPEKITCPTCHTDCQLGVGGVAGLLPDYGVCGVQVTTTSQKYFAHSSQHGRRNVRTLGWRAPTAPAASPASPAPWRGASTAQTFCAPTASWLTRWREKYFYFIKNIFHLFVFIYKDKVSRRGGIIYGVNFELLQRSAIRWTWAL